MVQDDWSKAEVSAAYREFDPTANAVLSAIEGDAVSELLAEFEDRHVSQSRAEDLVWNALADSWEVPPAASNLVPALAARAYERRIIRDGGGVAAACERYCRNMQTELEAEALFSPFDVKYALLTESRRAAIIAALVRYPRVSDRLWLGALSYATQR